ncbi:hypothetical protein EYZ11_007689 [Aspergillus tanneri]|uniref:Amino acid permease/ SLC12A domain-containing protein n=1 Tax=Aspergillus tanneri TaxID=1220188 RepID=A0A4S3JEJ2_9EURO|nr:uncharacterized protein ATNIH1004_004351 [Aspergillus tanneri]KAA8648466.1 hypothetical protein ATNIH1004_004351 [Aspergillus tanneri]THC92817.1 hypothetical protein EYZ11_007689 [Aspergillus tanneri]
MTVACLLGLINIGSSVALNDIVSMAVSGLYLSYLSVATLLFYRRVQGDIRDTIEREDMIVNTPGAPLVWGPFHVPGIFGIAVNASAIVYIIIVVFFSFWPTEATVKYDTMNYSVVGTFGTVIIALVYYAFRARKIYQGPVIETF